MKKKNNAAAVADGATIVFVSDDAIDTVSYRYDQDANNDCVAYQCHLHSYHNPSKAYTFSTKFSMVSKWHLSRYEFSCLTITDSKLFLAFSLLTETNVQVNSN